MQVLFIFVLAKSCGSPGQLRNGDVEGTRYTYERVVKFTCRPGYELKGASYRRCLENQKWTGDVPTCEGKQSLLFPVNNLQQLRTNAPGCFSLRCLGVASRGANHSKNLVRFLNKSHLIFPYQSHESLKISLNLYKSH